MNGLSGLDVVIIGFFLTMITIQSCQNLYSLSVQEEILDVVKTIQLRNY